MKIHIILHILEFTIAFIYVVLIWPVYEGEDYLWGCFICISYLMIIVSYSIMHSLLPAMKMACDVGFIPAYTWKQLVLANWNVGGGNRRNTFIRINNTIFGINPQIHGFKTFYYVV